MHEYINSTVYRSLNGDPDNGLLGCGFLVKTEVRSDRDLRFPYYGALLLLNGSGKYIGPDGKSIPLSPGCFVQRMPGVKHSTLVYPGERWTEFFVCFGRDYYEAMASLGLFSRKPVLYPGHSEENLPRCAALMKKFRTLPDSRLNELFLETQKFVISITEKDKCISTGGTDPRLSRAAKFLCTPSPDYPSPAEAAALVGMEYESFRKKFRTMFGCPPAAYQLRRRLDYAKQLLLDSDKSIEEVAFICRFSDPFAFSKSFRLHFGISPRQFRETHL